MSNLENSCTTSIGARIKAIRLYYRLNMKLFAKKLKVSHNYISEIESEKKNPSKLFLQAVIATFHINERWMLTGQGSMFDEQAGMIAESLLPYGPSSKRLDEILKKVIIIYNEGDIEARARVMGMIDAVHDELMRIKEQVGANPPSIRKTDRPVLKKGLEAPILRQTSVNTQDGGRTEHDRKETSAIDESEDVRDKAG